MTLRSTTLIETIAIACCVQVLMPRHLEAQPRTCFGQSSLQLVILGIGQDGGTPQAGTKAHAAFSDRTLRHYPTSIAVVSVADSARWLFEATPEFKDQLHDLDERVPVAGRPGLSGIFLTHAHIGHYLGLADLGHEVMGAVGVPVYAMPRMGEFLSSNGPWDQLVRFNNIKLQPLQDGVAVQLSEHLKVSPFLVPHRDEYSETVGYRIDGPSRSAIFIPDINKWEVWDKQGVGIEDLISDVDYAFVDGTFYANGEIPGRDMSGFPHPFISDTMDRFSDLSDEFRSKVFFIHLNHTNPALNPDSDASASIEERGFNVARRGDCFSL